MHCGSGQEKSEQALCERVLASLEEMLNQAYAQLAEGYFENAIDAFSKCLSIEPAEAKAYEGRAQANFRIKNWTAAIADFKKASELNPGEPENWVGLGMSLAMVNEIYPAIDIFEKLLSERPHYVRGHIQLGMLYYRLGIIKKGHEQMDLGLASRPSLAERRSIEQLKNEQLTLDKKRLYRPDFEALRRSNSDTEGVLKTLFRMIKKKFQN